MAVLPSTGAPGKGVTSTGARFRQRKISVKQPLTIYKQRDLPALDATNELEPSQVHHFNQSGSQQRDIHAIETGVDKNEEDEVHLQQVINAAQKALLGSKTQDKNKKEQAEKAIYIPTPDASRVWPEAYKYYNDFSFKEPESYIKFSATVEDTVGVEYNMDEADEEFLQKLNTQFKEKHKTKEESKRNAGHDDIAECSELEFELVCDKLEKIIEEKQPFLSMDPSNILSYEELLSYIIQEYNSSTAQTDNDSSYLSTVGLKEKLSKELKYEPFVTIYDKNAFEDPESMRTRPIPKLLDLFGKDIYEHWKERKIERKGRPIHPSLKFEDPNSNEKDNDNDPYICFRRREVRKSRKTRRADILGAERIRLLQLSLQRARNLVLSVCKREILNSQLWDLDEKVFNSRAKAKESKRKLGIKGDDHLFYSHKKRRIIRAVKEEEEQEKQLARLKRERRSKYEASRESSASIQPMSSTIHNNQKERYYNGQQFSQENASSGSQPYVKLPPSKIPDMDLVTVSLVLKEKNETIKRAVLEKIRKRKEQDKGYINVTDDPYQPFFNVDTNKSMHNSELTHVPYSSIASTKFYNVLTTNYISDNLRTLLEEGKRSLPGMRTFRGSNGELIPSKPFPHLSALLENHIDNKLNTNNYIAQLLSNIENNNFSAYSNGYGQFNEDDHESFGTEISEPIFRLRKRSARLNRTFIDRRGLFERPNEEIDSFLKEEPEHDDSNVPGIYAHDSKVDAVKRLDSRWRFDNDFSDDQKAMRNPFSLDPSRLNSISDDTQSIRFGSMLLSKSYDLLRESIHHRQQLLVQQARMRTLQNQHQQQQNAQKTAMAQGTSSFNTPNQNSIPLNSQNFNSNKTQRDLQYNQDPHSLLKERRQESLANNVSKQMVGARLPTQSAQTHTSSSSSPLLASQASDPGKDTRSK
ncbi:Piso0_003645 [Millerozyma farinosa CBS 7064]|uniref:Enhancer of polycomb-like protein n=1 Tax=Pichia sorbitophila (strain ATCC MYA-4447 / BCRC 22081 / CBS 7064 / NBRC 10061 / NRRL Y-12695) TaxID=559304 RepID=G8YGH4_PICSO|nr:Piso0_003645 [Millerozyma farinosa CBS 7064]CCE81291.1 Piso0_003645 [Millerozyma farinosa CBS 7064]